MTCARSGCQAAHAVLRVSFAKVAEYQQRGLVHFHAVIRLDGPDGTSQPPPPYATAAVLSDAVRAAAARVRVRVESDAVGERELGWGEQLDVREIAAFGADAEFTDQAVAAYVAKYATKSADASGTLDRSLFCRPCQGRGATLLPHGTPLPCTACDGTGQARPLSRLAVARHVRQMIRTCWDLGKLPEFADLKLWKWAHMLGFRGHFSTKSRSYSTTLGALRAARRVWRTEQARVHAGLPEPAPDTTLVVGHWAYQGSGYSPGAALLAAHVWHRRELGRQFVAEVRPTLELLTVPQVMARLQLGRSAVYDLLRSGQLASITLGRARRIPTHALTDFIRTRLEQEAAA
ncbi:replication initiator [Streptomyces sp. MUM 16J]|uniref:replication initiator n=1 Tax=Streptomyces sp. MUM 16J TaxID=2791988 RepID=UPI0027E4E3A3|nr:replication initiator [Streptomyces sp. MUM 16J]MCH0561471.1 helix-turn-helix domain-containing protein [Streptomyces sp. MUM 16J]